MMLFSAPWMDKEMITLNPGIQIGKDKYHVLSPTGGKGKKSYTRSNVPSKMPHRIVPYLAKQQFGVGGEEKKIRD